ncbi:MAG TPA: sulfur carrier protein ThiS [Burkholderiales bacterium]|nr:sulfur carrier protein ThiS [Burkholderiales bacterium]
MNSSRVVESNKLFHLAYRRVIGLSINGKPHRFDDGINVAQVLERLALNGKRLALEKNGEIVPRSRFTQEKLQDGDKLEIVVAVGGG